MNEEPYLPVETAAITPARVRRVSWGAIFAGTFVMLVFQIMFILLGAAVGLSTLQTADRQQSGQQLALGAAIWLLVSSLVAVWIGACVAGRLSGGPRRADGMLHGIVTWSLSTLTLFAVMAAGIGAVLGGATALLGSAGAVAGNVQGEQGTIASVQDVIKGLFPQNGSLLPPTGRTAPGQPVPGELTAMAQQDPDLKTALARLESKGGVARAPQEREQIINLLTSKHNLNQQDAANLVTQWDQQFQQVRSEAGGKAKPVDQATAEGISQGALWSFVAMILGLLVAAWGGWVGTASIRKPTATVLAPS